jgi:hypothetical protein
MAAVCSQAHSERESFAQLCLTATDNRVCLSPHSHISVWPPYATSKEEGLNSMNRGRAIGAHFALARCMTDSRETELKGMLEGLRPAIEEQVR